MAPAASLNRRKSVDRGSTTSSPFRATSHAVSRTPCRCGWQPTRRRFAGTRNARAYEAYLRGKALYNLAKDEASDREARANFELAIANDPDFALARAALSRVLASLASQNAKASELKPLYAAAVQQAERAIDLAPTLAVGHLALGYAKFAGFLDVRGARPSVRKGLRIWPGRCGRRLALCLVHRPHSPIRRGAGRDPARACAGSAQPSNPSCVRPDRIFFAPLRRRHRRLPPRSSTQSANLECQCLHRQCPDADEPLERSSNGDRGGKERHVQAD